MPKENTLAREATNIALRQLQTSWNFKLPRIRQINKYRRLYNVQIEPRMRSQFNVPLPIFSGMVDTLQADLNDRMLLKYKNTDPADWKAVQKVNSAIEQVSTSMRPEAQWNKKFRAARQECILTGRGILKFTAGTHDKEYYSNLEVVPFEDFFFEPSGGGNLENHLFVGQQNIWRTKQQLLDGVADGMYDAGQVKKLTEIQGNGWKMSGIWDGNYDFGNRFLPLGLNVDSNNYVGEDVYNLCEWVLEYKGRRWYVLFEAYTGEWIRFEKLSDINSSEYIPFMSFASHEDLKNFASKSFGDDLYPIADSAITLFNQELTNRQKRNLNAKAYDKDMFKDLGKLDEAQYRPDALVPADTKGGTRRISEGVYAFNTPELTGTIDIISWLETDTGKNLGVTDIQQGASQEASKRVGVAYAELSQVSKRLDFMSQPFLEVGQQLGIRFFASLKDYMKEPMAIKMLGETGIEWDLLNRVDLNVKKDFEISVTSQANQDGVNDAEAKNEIEAMNLTAGSPNINSKVRDEMILRKIGKFNETDIALLMDTNSETTNDIQSEVSAAIQDIILGGKMPKQNYNADMFFMRRLIDFAKDHKDTLSAKKFDMLMQYADMHKAIVAQNMQDKASQQAQQQQQQMMMQGQQQLQPK